MRNLTGRAALYLSILIGAALFPGASIAQASLSTPAHAPAEQPKQTPADNGKPKELFITVVVPALMGLIGAIVGGLIAGFASLKAVDKANTLARVEEANALKRKQTIIRTLLFTEVQTNLDMLKSDEEYVDANPPDVSRIHHAGVTPCPQWSRDVWRESILSLSGALNDAEIASTQKFYAALDTISSARHNLHIAVTTGDRYDQTETPFTFYRAVASALIELGNPLVSQAAPPKPIEPPQ